MLARPFEPWHWRMAFSSLLVGLYAAGVVAAALSPSALPSTVGGLLAAGIAVLAVVVYAALVSRFWTNVRSLAQPHKSAVWLVAIAGFVLGGVVVVGVLIALHLLRDS